MKKLAIYLTILAMVFFWGVISASTVEEQAAKIENPIEIMPLWVNVNWIDLDISFSSNTAFCSGRIRGHPDVNSITATFTLRRLNGNGTTTTIETWPNLTSNTTSLNFSGTGSPVYAGQRYRLEVTATLVTTSGVRETVYHSFTRSY